MPYNLLPLIVKEGLKKNPEGFTLPEDFTAQVEQTTKKFRDEQNKRNPPQEKRWTPKQELSKLRSQLFQLKEAVKHADIYANNIAGTVELLEQRIDNTYKVRKLAIESGNVRQERNYDAVLRQLEGELADAKKEHERALKQSADATRALRHFDGAQRLIELQALVGGAPDGVHPQAHQQVEGSPTP